MTRLQYALRYAERGFRIFPLHWIVVGDGGVRRCSCADHDCRSAGKHPLTVKGVHDATVDAGVITGWYEQWPHANIGMALGGEQRLHAIDIDPRNGGDATLAVLTETHGAMPDTVLALTGGGGTHYIYSVPEGIKLPGKLGKGIDIKGEGGYIVVEPSMHASGVAYAWEASSDPLEGFAPAAMPQWILDLAQSPAQMPGAPSLAARTVGMISREQRLELDSALPFIDCDDRDNWLKVGMALHSTAAPEAYAIWESWSQRSPKFRAPDQKRVWNSFHSDGKISVTTIFAMAQEGGWINPKSAQAQKFNEAVEAAIALANTPSKVELVAEAPLPVFDALPVPILEEMAQWIDRRYPTTHPLVTRHGVLALAALVASRVFVGDGGVPANMCLGVVADTSSIAYYVKDAIATILSESGMRRMMRAGRVTSPQHVYGTLFRAPASMFVLPDFGHMVQFAKRQPSGALDHALSVMADAYNSSAIYIDSAADAGMRPSATDDQLVVYSPALTALLISTSDQAQSLLQRGEIARGLLGHQFAIIANVDGADEKIPVSEEVPRAFKDALRSVRRKNRGDGDLSIQDIFGAQACFKPQVVKARCEISVLEHLAAVNAISAEPEHRPLVIAGQDTFRRLVVVLASWSNPEAPSATRELIDWACAYVIRHLRTWIAQYAVLGSEDGTADVGQKIVAAIAARKTRGIQRAHLQRSVWAFRKIRDAEKRTKLIDMLIADDEIEEVVSAGVKVLVAKQFVRRTDLSSQKTTQCVGGV